jgi:hypothetical protein
MTSVLLDNETILGKFPESVLHCSDCENSVNISDFETIAFVFEALQVDENRDFVVLGLKENNQSVSFSRESVFKKFEFSSFELAESFYNAVEYRKDFSKVSYADRIFCLSFPELRDNKYIVSFYQVEMKFYCSRCTQLCNSCDTEYLNRCNGIVTFDNTIICENCYSDNYFTCENCDYVFLSRRSCFINDRSSYWCEGCASDEATWCEYHDSYEQDLCDSNYESDDVENWNRQDYEGIYSYSFKPRTPDFFLGSADSDNQKLTFGFELEVESEGAKFSDGLKIIKDCLGDFVYMKGDGSLNNGYEIVTYPFSFNYYQEAIDFSFLNKLQELGYRSWTPETCGFHIHIGRTGFESAGHIWKFANLILQNPKAWQKLAGRSGERWATFSMAHNQVMKVLKGELSPERYVAVNMTNADTIEVRFFRGSLNETRLRSAIESIYLAIEYTRTLSVHDINQGGLKFESFVNYLVNKGFFANGFSSFSALLEKYDLINLIPATFESEK